MEYRATRDGSTVALRVVSLDLGCPVDNALEIPAAVRDSRIIEATTGQPLKKD